MDPKRLPPFEVLPGDLESLPGDFEALLAAAFCALEVMLVYMVTVVDRESKGVDWSNQSCYLVLIFTVRSDRLFMRF